ncbi:hypothetical protein RFI_29902 [Reticulomyxa filosa]|uniref:Uncharacterized protein n=1 Tax=Reticulomyxa filosa TaxID=46433 RepID=X6M0V0_RETFI|nr:hypothetical protein RFI_29902 [Reticulomyxa filosa]|eukprot:ETO07489.1 hypothetical protein RFI_29902 [Reticulomyxa filosa]
MTTLWKSTQRQRTQRQNVTNSNNLTIGPTVKKGQMIGWQVYDPSSRARDWTIGKIFMERRYPFTTIAEKKVVRDIKEKLSHVTFGYENQLKKADISSELEQNYSFPDGQVITVGADQFQCLEVLFKSSFIGLGTLITKGSHKKGCNNFFLSSKKQINKQTKNREIQRQTQQHAQLCHLLGIGQLIICVTKMDDPSVKCDQDRFEESK